jgi:hypothetical protein
MSLYDISIFLHVLGALALFAALGVEWAGLIGLRRAHTTAQVREWVRLFAGLRRVAGPAALIILVTGVYMSTTRWGRQPWIGLGLIGLVTIAALAPALTGRRVGSMARAIPDVDGPIPPALRDRITDPVLRLSAWLRTGISLGVVFLMTVKPGSAEALAALGVSVVLGLVAGLSAWANGRRPLTTAEGDS